MSDCRKSFEEWYTENHGQLPQVLSGKVGQMWAVWKSSWEQHAKLRLNQPSVPRDAHKWEGAS